MQIFGPRTLNDPTLQTVADIAFGRSYFCIGHTIRKGRPGKLAVLENPEIIWAQSSS
jgi:hypothetical protein